MKKERIKKNILILLLIIVTIPVLSILGLFLYGWQSDLSGKDVLHYFIHNVLLDKKTFLADDKTCSIKAPSDWTTVPGRKGNSIIRVGRLYCNEDVVVIPYHKKDITTSSLDELTEVVLESFKKDVTSPNISKTENIEINNGKASIIVGNGIVGNTSLAYTIYILETKDAFFHFICSAMPSNKKYANKIFREIVESFKVLPKKKEVQKKQEPPNQK